MKRTGVALVAVLSMVLIISAVVFGMTYTTQFTDWIMRNDSTSTAANYIAIAGLQRYRTVLLQNYKGSFASTTTGSSTNGCLSAPTSLLDLDRTDNAIIPTPAPKTSMTESINGGSVTVTLARDTTYPNLVTLTSTGTYGGATSRARSVLNLTYTGLFSYAFLGQASTVSGGGAQAITGNVTIAGGIYVEGSSSDTTNSNTVLTLGNGVSQGDSYNLSTSSHLYNVTNLNGVNNLCSSVRVRYGNVILQSSQTNPNPSIGSSSNPINGIQVGNSSGGSTDAVVYSCSNNWRNNCNIAYSNTITPQNCSGGLCATNIGRYDLPSTSAPHLYNLDLQTGETGFTCNGSTNQSWRQCLNNDPSSDSKTLLLVRSGSLPSKKLNGTNNTLTTPSNSTCNLSPSNSNPLVNSSNVMTLSSDINCVYTYQNNPVLGFKYTSSSRLLAVYGNVIFQGIDFAPSSSSTITYRASGYNTSTLGAAALVFEHKCSTVNSNLSCGGSSASSSNGAVTLTGDLLPDTSFGKFPLQTLAVVADGNSSSTDALTVNAGVAVAAILYSTQRLHLLGTTNSPNNMAGVLIGDTLCVGNSSCSSGSANIYYVDPTTSIPLPSALAFLPNPEVASVQILSSERY